MGILSTFNSFSSKPFAGKNLFAVTTIPFRFTLYPDSLKNVTISNISTTNKTVSLDWGDGNIISIPQNTTSSYSHTYSTIGYKNVSITGEAINGIRFGTYITSVNNWGTIKFNTFESMFTGATGLTGVATATTPNYIPNASMAFMFSGARKFNSTTLNNWRVSEIANMQGMFQNCSNFVGNLSSWNVSNVTNMQNMFTGTKFNQDISIWNVSKVNNMNGMFSGTTLFNQNISIWNTSNVTNMNGMFYGALAFNQPIGTWNTSKVTDMGGMFAKSDAIGALPVVFNQNIGNWKTGNVTNMIGMFANNTSFNQNLSSWCVTNIPTKPSLFDTGATSWTLPKPVWGTCPNP